MKKGYKIALIYIFLYVFLFFLLRLLALGLTSDVKHFFDAVIKNPAALEINITTPVYATAPFPFSDDFNTIPPPPTPGEDAFYFTFDLFVKYLYTLPIYFLVLIYFLISKKESKKLEMFLKYYPAIGVLLLFVCITIVLIYPDSANPPVYM